MSATTGSVCTTSPSDDSLTIRTRTARRRRLRRPPDGRSMRRHGHPGVGLYGAQGRHAFGLDALERLGRRAFEAEHEHGRRVGGADEAEAVFVLDANAVDGDDLACAGKLRFVEDPGDHCRRLALDARHVELGRAEARGQGIEHGARVAAAAQDLEQAARRVGGVVEAVPALAEEDVPAHFAGERWYGFDDATY